MFISVFQLMVEELRMPCEVPHLSHMLSCLPTYASEIWAKVCSLTIWDLLAACHLHAHKQCLNTKQNTKLYHAWVASMQDE